MRGAERVASAVVLAAFAVLLAMPAIGTIRTDLDREWAFRADPEDKGTASGWYSTIPAGTESVTVPHTWNIGRLHDYHGVAWYFRNFTGPPHSGTGHVELHFGATFYSARVWLNGVELGTHEGGFTEYSFDITPRLRRTNVLVVRLDNRSGMATIPGIAARGGPNASYDWWTYGGLVRDVWLTTTGPVWVNRQEIRTVRVTGGAAVVHDRVLLAREPDVTDAAEQTGATVHVTAFGPDNRVEADAVQPIPPARGSSEINVALNLPDPKVWSIDHPDIYRMVVTVRDRNNQLLDEETSTFGVRTFEISGGHLLINGERVRLTGIARHEDSPWEGLAETRGTIQQDYADMKALHTTLTRPVHYPQNPLVLDYADRHGIVLIPEIPVWQFSEAQLADPRVLDLARRQIREVIEQAGNHPSILGWSVANESATGTPGGIAYFRAMREFIHSLDPGRPVSFADDNLPKVQRPEQSAANDADFLMMNQYFGSWHGPAEALEPALEQVHRLYPDKMVIISEMGYAGIFAHDAVEADRARIRTMREQMPVLAARDWIGGAILWCYQDYKSPRNLWPGLTEGYVEHGLVDEARQRKPSYNVWKDLNRPARLAVHWVGAPEQPPSGFSVEVTPNTERDLPFYPLHGFRVTWSVLDAKGRAVVNGDRQLGELAQPIDITGTLPAASPAASSSSPGKSGVATSPDGLIAPAQPDDRLPKYQLTVTLLSPTGFVAASERLEWPQSTPTAENVLLWPNGAPGSEDKHGVESTRLSAQGEHIVSNVHAPSISATLPAPEKSNGAAVVVIPGGGHVELWMDHEGYNVAGYLAAHGIAAFVLKYRLARTPGSTYTVERDSLADVGRAIRLVRSRASEWHIDSNRLGVLGFSAGGELAALAATRYDDGKGDAADPVERQSSRPNFAALLYPAIPKEMRLTKSTPPAFLLGGADDVPAISQGLAMLYVELRKAGVPAELHVYDGVGHGFGLRFSNAGPVAAWPGRFLEWLRARGLIDSRMAD